MIRAQIHYKPGRKGVDSIRHVPLCTSVSSASEVETVQITEKTVNPQGERVAPNDFQLLKVLGKGGYGKVSECNASLLSYHGLDSGFSSEKSRR